MRTVRTRYLTPEVAANFIEILHNSTADILPQPCDFIVDHFNNKLRPALDTVAPLSTKILSIKPTPPWIKTEIKQLKRNCRSAERKWRQTKLTVHCDIFWDKLKTYNKAVKQARTSHFSQLISDKKNNHKFLFSTIARLIKARVYNPGKLARELARFESGTSSKFHPPSPFRQCSIQSYSPTNLNAHLLVGLSREKEMP